MLSPLSSLLVDDAVARALKEDLGDAGDITTQATIPADTIIKAVVAARKSGVIAGTELGRTTLRMTGPTTKTLIKSNDGTRVSPGDIILEIEGPARDILSAERVALNFMGHLSGIATATAALVDAVQGTRAKIVCTRKTTPGLRALEKHAVRAGGGQNHRFGLYDAVMIKDNHIAASGGISKALERARQMVGHTVKIEIEIDHVDQLEDALSGGADIVLLDNMSTNDLAHAVKLNNGRAVLEASGNVTIETVRDIAVTGVDIISSGWITHSAPTLDLGMDFA